MNKQKINIHSVHDGKLLTLFSLSFSLARTGLKYQSNLNEIDKSEQKSQVDSSSKVFEWPSKDEEHADSKYFESPFTFSDIFNLNFIEIHWNFVNTYL